MSETLEDITFDDLYREFPIFYNLPLSKLYSIISLEDDNDQSYDLYCHSYLKSNDSDVCDIQRLCTRAYNILSIIKSWVSSSYLDNRIKYLEHFFYWIYDYKRTNKQCDDKNKLYTQLNRGEGGIFEEDDSYINNFNISEPDFIKKKALFLHAEILYWIVHAKDRADDIDSELYNKYLDKCANTYKNIICNNALAENATYKKEATDLKNNFYEAISFLKEKITITEQEEKSWNDKLMCQSELQGILPGEGRQVAKEDAGKGDGGEGPVAEKAGKEKEGTEEAEEEGRPEESNGDSGLGVARLLLTESTEGQVAGSRGEMIGRAVHTIDMDSDVSEVNSNPIVTNPVGTILYTSLGSVLPLVTLYKFNAVSSFPEYDSELSNHSEDEPSLFESWCQSIIQRYTIYENYDISKTCPNAMKYLTSIKQKGDDIYFEKGCLYLYFWLYRKSKNISSYIETTLSLFKEILKEYGTLQHYTINLNTEIIDNLMYEKLSFVYNLNDYYNKYIKKSDCENDNCNCARKCAELYKMHINECNKYFHSPFCIELTKFRQNFNEQIKKDDTCNKSVKSLPSFQNYSLETIIVIPIIVISVIGFLVFTLYRVHKIYY